MAKRRSNAKIREFDVFLSTNPIQIPVEYNKKKFTTHDIKSIQPMTRNQTRLFELWNDDYSFVLDGSAGSGKSLCSIYLAIQDILSPDTEYEKLVIVRSSVPTRDIGFLPGSLEEKMEVYEQPYSQIFDFIFKKKNQYKFMKEAGIVEFLSTSFMRGTTFDNCIIILDEAAGCNYHEISTIMTRLGNNSKIVVVGDTKQNDLIYRKNDVSGFAKFLQVSSRMPSIRQVTFTISDCVRSGLCREFLVADDQFVD